MTRRNTRKLLQEGLKELRLPTIRSSFQQVGEQARAESLSYEEFLLALVDQERDVRRQGRIARALRASNLPLEKTLEGFERKRLPRKVDAHINVLLEGAFLDQCENVLAFGPPGSGKSHLLHLWCERTKGRRITPAQLDTAAVPELATCGAVALDGADSPAMARKAPPPRPSWRSPRKGTPT